MRQSKVNVSAEQKANVCLSGNQVLTMHKDHGVRIHGICDGIQSLSKNIWVSEEQCIEIEKILHEVVQKFITNKEDK